MIDFIKIQSDFKNLVRTQNIEISEKKMFGIILWKWISF